MRKVALLSSLYIPSCPLILVMGYPFRFTLSLTSRPILKVLLVEFPEIHSGWEPYLDRSYNLSNTQSERRPQNDRYPIHYLEAGYHQFFWHHQPKLHLINRDTQDTTDTVK